MIWTIGTTEICVPERAAQRKHWWSSFGWCPDCGQLELLHDYSEVPWAHRLRELV